MKVKCVDISENFVTFFWEAVLCYNAFVIRVPNLFVFRVLSYVVLIRVLRNCSSGRHWNTFKLERSKSGSIVYNACLRNAWQHATVKLCRYAPVNVVEAQTVYSFLYRWCKVAKVEHLCVWNKEKCFVCARQKLPVFGNVKLKHWFNSHEPVIGILIKRGADAAFNENN